MCFSVSQKVKQNKHTHTQKKNSTLEPPSFPPSTRQDQTETDGTYTHAYNTQTDKPSKRQTKENFKKLKIKIKGGAVWQESRGRSLIFL